MAAAPPDGAALSVAEGARAATSAPTTWHPGIAVQPLPAAPNGNMMSRQGMTGMSMASVDSRRSAGYRSSVAGGSSVPTVAPSNAGYSMTSKPRRFASRHVPNSAEELVQEQVLNPEIANRLSGLMRHLKRNTEWEEQQKQVMVSEMDMRVPEEYDETIRLEFERRCAFGERMNTELMNSAKWIKLLKDINVIIPIAASQSPMIGMIQQSEADIIFHKVLHDCDYGGRRMTYELFCKALYLVARAVRPDLDAETGFQHVLMAIVQVAPEEEDRKNIDFMLDANVLLVLDHFKPPLYDIFKTFCNRHLSNVGGDGRHGTGTVRLRERTVFKHTRDTELSRFSALGDTNFTMGGGGTRSEPMGRLRAPSRESLGEMSQGLQPSASIDALPAAPGAEASGGLAADASKQAQPVEQDGEAAAGAPAKQASPPVLAPANAEADAGGGHQLQQHNLQQHQQQLLQQQLQQQQLQQLQLQQGPLPGLSRPRSTGQLHAPNVLNGTQLTLEPSFCGSTATKPPSKDNTLFANGAPVIRDRRSHMSIDQLMDMCRELKIVPDLLSRLEVVQVFKRAQTAGSSSSTGSSLYGYLTRETFVDAAGQLAIEAYSKSPYSEEYPAAHEKISAFLITILPGSAREVHERFMYGCSGRWKPGK
eukprot:TRINITY_DN20824_c0_g1_i1.p1 TRINITY_DN20824_c0_g1~~TRINITY_DN20824_c0_g1_i1.p1  ORF type:complete len:671 (-),score=143.06 TRINITY_DN20824_c0_g1_i1:92-2035(-)